MIGLVIFYTLVLHCVLKATIVSRNTHNNSRFLWPHVRCATSRQVFQQQIKSKQNVYHRPWENKSVVECAYAFNLPIKHRRKRPARRKHRSGKRKENKIQVVTGVTHGGHSDDHFYFQTPFPVFSNPICNFVQHLDAYTQEHSNKQRQKGVNRKNLVSIPLSNSEHLSVLYCNAQSSRNKAMRINELILDSKVDLLFITESWLKKEGDEPIIKEMLPSGYDIIPEPRTSRGGGGVAVIHRECMNVVKCESEASFSSFEHCTISFKAPEGSLICSCIYRPPRNGNNQITPTVFIEEFSDFIGLKSSVKNLFLVGDLNFHFDNDKDNSVKHLNALFEEHDLKQLVTEATHKKGHLLDPVLCRTEFKTSEVLVSDICLSDHFLISFEIGIGKPKLVPKLKYCRNIKSINVQDFKNSLCDALTIKTKVSMEDLNTILLDTLNTHAPILEKTVRPRPSAPWLNQRFLDAKNERRKAERQWKKTKLNVHKEIYIAKVKETCAIAKEEKMKFYNEQIVGSESCKDLFNVCNVLLGKENPKILPNDQPSNQLPQAFSDFFSNKISKIRKSLDNCDLNVQTNIDAKPSCSFSHFEPVSEDFVKSIIIKSPKNFCELDPLPAGLFMECIDVLLPHITAVINDSLTSGVVPSCFKFALVKPLIKKSTLNPNELKNYRPVSNLPFLSKILEKVVLSQINTYLDENDFKETLQSAYKRKHSTETALLKVQSDLLRATDDGMVTVLALLDLSAAFDTIDHGILLDRLNILYGFEDTALEWFASYISQRQQAVVIEKNKSEKSILNFGVPQGSVLGPILFSLYSQPLCNTLTSNGFNYHIYADDTQIYKSIHIEHLTAATDSLVSCVADVAKWMASNKLQLNKSKTEVLVVGTEHKISKVEISKINLCGDEVTIVNKVRNLGVIFDSTLSMEHQISHLRKVCYLELRRISQIGIYLTPEAKKKLVVSLILSRLDYCNALLPGLPEKQLKRLQQIQNHAARFVMKASKTDHVTPLLKELHWLPVEKRIEFKILSIAYQCQSVPDFPSYLKDMVQPYVPARALRSLDQSLLHKPRSKLKTFGDRTLPFFAAGVWNTLPLDIRQAPTLSLFKKKLKTHLFLNYFDS